MWPPPYQLLLDPEMGGAGETHRLRWGLDLIQGWKSPTSRVQSDHWHTVIPRKKARCVGGTIISALLCVK